MKVVHADGKTETWEAKAGEAGWLKTEGPHTSENIGKTTMGFVLVEVKSAAKSTAKKASKEQAGEVESQGNTLSDTHGINRFDGRYQVF